MEPVRVPCCFYKVNDLDVKKTSIGYISISQLYVTYR